MPRLNGHRTSSRVARFALTTAATVDRTVSDLTTEQTVTDAQ